MEKTLVKGLTLLEAIARSNAPCGVTELSKKLDLTKSNTFRLLQTLVAAKYVQHDAETGLYGASPRLFELGMLVGNRFDVRVVARPLLGSLVGATGESASIGILEGHDVLFLDRVDSPNPVRAILRNGERLPAYASSCGKVLLAWSSDEIVNALSGRLSRFTAHTVTSTRALKRDLSLIREQGYAVVRGEWHLEISSVAAPIFYRDGKIVSAMMVSGPTARFTCDKTPRLIEAVCRSARQVSEHLP
jgi:DNA-binding IclR family transcriptional regulator